MSMDPTSTSINNEEIQSLVTLVDETATPSPTPIVTTRNLSKTDGYYRRSVILTENLSIK